MPCKVAALLEEVRLEVGLGSFGGFSQRDRESEMGRTVSDTEQVIDVLLGNGGVRRGDLAIDLGYGICCSSCGGFSF